MINIAENEDKNKIEAVLFAAGRAVDAEEMSKLTKIPVDHIKKLTKELKHDLESRNSPLILVEEANAWKLTVGEKHLELVKNITPHTELDRSMLETLAVIAWKQPVMQSELIKIRTSSAYEHIKQLVEMGFISKIKKGRSFVLKPTGTFFDYFDLPSKEAVKELFKDIEAMEAEMQQKIAEEKGEKTEKKEGKVGDLETYNVPKKEEEKEKELGHEAEKIGKLEVYQSKKERKHKEHEEKEEMEEEKAEEGKEEEAIGVAEKILKEERKEEPEDKEEEEEKRLPDELEEFAGKEEMLGEEKEETEEEKEE